MYQLNIFKKFFIMALIISIVLFYCFWNYSSVLSFQSIAPRISGKDIKGKVCYVKLSDERNWIRNNPELNMIYYVTPTYPRPEQVPELTRLGHTLMHVPRIYWIVADDQEVCSQQVIDVLKKTGLPFTHISSPKPSNFKGTNFPRGVANRRAALTWLRKNAHQGVLYFGDDDNTVDLQLFDEIRNTKKVSMFPVGLIGDYGVSSPIVKNGKVVGFFDSWPASRLFPIDMAGFAVNIDFLKPSASMPYIAGHEEDRFLISTGLKVEDIEPMADNCSKIMVWHTRTCKFKKPTLNINIKKLEESFNYNSFVKLLKETSELGMANFDIINGNNPYVTFNRKTSKTLIDFN